LISQALKFQNSGVSGRSNRVISLKSQLAEFIASAFVSTQRRIKTPREKPSSPTTVRIGNRTHVPPLRSALSVIHRPGSPSPGTRSGVGKFVRNYINLEEFKIAGEVPLLLKIRLQHLLRRNRGTGTKVLVVDTCIVGDFIGTLPALRAFIKSTDRQVDLVVSPLVTSIAESIRGVHSVYTARTIYNRSSERRDERTALPGDYDTVLVLRISPEAYDMLDQIRCRTITTYEGPYLKYFAHLLWNIYRKKPVRQWREVNFEMARIEEPKSAPTFEEIFDIDRAAIDRVKEFPELNGKRKRILIHTGSGWHIKLLANATWREAIRKINDLGNFDFIFIGGGNHEAKSFEEIQRNLGFRVYSLINAVDLRTTLLVMRLSDYFIGIDSGPRNMAHLADLRSVSILGPAPKNFMPLSSADVVIDKFDCRCKSLFYFHHVSALEKLSADEIVNGFKNLLTLTERNHTEQPFAEIMEQQW
jgi:ADP-heptose:LPS heptosyltransferase